jgi:hypothetical protein
MVNKAVSAHAIAKSVENEMARADVSEPRAVATGSRATEKIETLALDLEELP